MSSYRIQIGNVVRDLPLREVAPGVTIALFNILGDWELTEAAGKELARLVPAGTEALVMPDGKATALLHVMGRETGLPTFVARKEYKPYMGHTVTVHVQSITTKKTQELHLSYEDGARLNGKSVAIVDDVVSTGGTLDAMIKLLSMNAVQARHTGTMAVFTEGATRDNVIALGHLPISF